MSKAKSGGELDLIVHIFKPDKRTDVWSFYAAFERMLTHRAVVDPYLEWTKANRSAPAAAPSPSPSQSPSPSPSQSQSQLDAYTYSGSASTRAQKVDAGAIFRHFCPEVIDLVQKKYAAPPKLTRRDSDIDVGFSDDEIDDAAKAGDRSGSRAAHDDDAAAEGESDASEMGRGEGGSLSSEDRQSPTVELDSNSSTSTSEDNVLDQEDAADDWEDYSSDGALVAFTSSTDHLATVLGPLQGPTGHTSTSHY
jgi:hypothetical protein